jgi:hypothetical protein
MMVVHIPDRTWMLILITDVPAYVLVVAYHEPVFPTDARCGTYAMAGLAMVWFAQ